MTTYIPSLTLPTLFFENPAAAILLPIAAGTAIGFSTRPKDTQKTYLALRQPPFRPPPWLFGPAWTVLYGCMGYAAYRAWKTGMNSFDGKKIMLTQVRIPMNYGTQRRRIENVWLMCMGSIARRNDIYRSTRSEFTLDAALLRVTTTDRSDRRCGRVDRFDGLFDVYLGTGG